jgi:quercetin dioxygenase-like cupin family protein
VTEYLFKPLALAAFNAERFTKADLARGDHIFLGLNCFQPGQSQAVHTHANADKFYLVLSGKARMAIGGRVTVAETGDLIWCPAGVEHGVEEALEATVLVVGMATTIRTQDPGLRTQ